jgi:hypothetical protein
MMSHVHWIFPECVEYHYTTIPGERAHLLAAHGCALPLLAAMPCARSSAARDPRLGVKNLSGVRSPGGCGGLPLPGRTTSGDGKASGTGTPPMVEPRVQGSSGRWWRVGVLRPPPHPPTSVGAVAETGPGRAGRGNGSTAENAAQPGFSGFRARV